MGVFEPWHTITVLISIFVIVIFSMWGYRAGKTRAIGPVGGLFLGLFFNIIGIIIVYLTPKTAKKAAGIRV
jgi:hypothetical protein